MSDEINQEPSGKSVIQGEKHVQYSKEVAEQVVALLKTIQENKLSIPFTFKTVSPTSEEQELMGKMNDRLVGKIQLPERIGGKCIKPISVAFPQCSDVLLSLINTKNTDEITRFFNDYFMFCDHSIIIDQGLLNGVLDEALRDCAGSKWSEVVGRIRKCTEKDDVNSSNDCKDYPYPPTWPPIWPSPWCLPPSCVTLAGTRHFYLPPKVTNSPTGRIKKLFIADLVWLFYFERMGIFKILGVILDDFATKGKIPISNGVVDPGIQDDVIAIVLESMVRQTKMGLSSTVRDRDSSYRRCLGWTSDVGRKLGLEAVVNSGFNNLFHKFIRSALEYYKDKRLAVAIQAAAAPGKPSVATLITISDTLDLVKKAFDPFDYGRNYSNTLNGIVWVVAGMALIRDLKETLGIPPAYDKPYEYIPAAYDLLVMKRQITPSETNRYTVHRECADDARDILLDFEVIDHTDTSTGGELERWLNIIEDKIEGYRTAYRSLTGVDLGMPPAPGTPTVEQQV